jgi:uncharacterized protein (PEP-CTERM system associated)
MLNPLVRRRRESQQLEYQMIKFKLAPLLKALSSGVVLACGTGVVLAQAQDPAQERGELVDSEPTLWVEPSVSASLNLSNNGNLASIGGAAEQTLAVSAGVLMLVNRPSVRGDIDYTISTVHFAQGTSRNDLRHVLDAEGTFNLVDQRVFVDASGLVSNQTLSPFLPLQGVLVGDVNRTQASSFRVSPYIVGTLGTAVDYQLRYAAQKNGNDVDDRADVKTRELSFQLGSRSAGQKFGWLIDGYSKKVDFTLNRSSKFERLSGRLEFALMSDLTFSLQVGTEANDLISAQRKTYQNIGLNLEWRPSPRTRLFAAVEDRFFGNGHSISLEHRTGRMVWRALSTRRADSDTTLESALNSAAATVGTLFNLLDGYYSQIEPNEILRRQLIEKKLEELGLPEDLRVSQYFFSAATTLENRQELSMAYLGLRDTIGLTLVRVNSRRLGTVINLGDDFDNNATIEQLGVTIQYGHRLTPLTSLNASISSERNTGTAVNAMTRLNYVVVGLTTSLARRTSASLQLRRTRYSSPFNPYSETAISGVITTRF